MRTTRVRGLDTPRAAAHACAAAANRRNHPISSLPRTSLQLQPPTSALSDQAQPPRPLSAVGSETRAHLNRQATASRRVLPALNAGVVEAAMSMRSPVRGVPASAGRARSGREGAEACDPDGLATGKRVGDGREHGAHGGVGVRAGQRSLGGDAGGEVGLVHSGSPPRGRSFKRITLPEIGAEGIGLQLGIGSSVRFRPPVGACGPPDAPVR